MAVGGEEIVEEPAFTVTREEEVLVDEQRVRVRCERRPRRPVQRVHRVEEADRVPVVE